jgi:RNA recognition motif-containing protein
MNSFHQIMDMMRNASSDGVKRVYSDDSGMGSILDTESLISVGGPSSSSTGLFGSPRAMPIDMNKEERFSRKVFVGGLPPDIDEGKILDVFLEINLIICWIY